MPRTVGSPLLWAGFTVFILCLLALDLGVFRRKDREMGTPEALRWVLLWVGLALAFSGYIFKEFGTARGLEYLTGYLIEYALSVDNIFVFLVIFSYFAVPPAHQRRVLFWGVLGAIVLRAIFILLGAKLLYSFHWIIYVFGGFLMFTGFKILVQGSEEVHPERGLLVRLFRRMVPTLTDYHGSRFLVRRRGRLYATPLLLVLLVVEATDLVFAVDSIPAIFAITKDPFIVYTSNIFAILGLRSLYFLLCGALDKFRYLKVGLGAVLIFIGIKMLLGEVRPIPVGWSLAVVCFLLGGSVIASLLRPDTTPPLPVFRRGDDLYPPPFRKESKGEPPDTREQTRKDGDDRQT